MQKRCDYQKINCYQHLLNQFQYGTEKKIRHVWHLLTGWQATKEGHRAQQPKHCKNNKDEEGH